MLQLEGGVGGNVKVVAAGVGEQDGNVCGLLHPGHDAHESFIHFIVCRDVVFGIDDVVGIGAKQIVAGRQAGGHAEGEREHVDYSVRFHFFPGNFLFRA